MVAEDLDFVLKSWRESYRMSHMAGPIPMTMYRDVYDAVLRQLLQRPDVEVRIAHARGQRPPDDIFGWIAVERDAWTRERLFNHELGEWGDVDVQLKQPVVHYLYVKHAFRDQGVARALLAAAGVDPERPWVHTFSTAVVAKMRTRHRDGRQRLNWAGAFDPRLCRFPKKQIPKHEPTEE
jgi:GNAT superfamily N-acetyltransferase